MVTNNPIRGFSCWCPYYISNIDRGILNYNGGMMMMKALDIILLVCYLAEMEVKDGIMLQIET